MSTNKWYVQSNAQEDVTIMRMEDGIPIAQMMVSVETGDGLLNHDEAIDVAGQVVEWWNSECEDLESGF